jgi:hypothetical protein
MMDIEPSTELPARAATQGAIKTIPAARSRVPAENCLAQPITAPNDNTKPTNKAKTNAPKCLLRKSNLKRVASSTQPALTPITIRPTPTTMQSSRMRTWAKCCPSREDHSHLCGLASLSQNRSFMRRKNLSHREGQQACAQKVSAPNVISVLSDPRHTARTVRVLHRPSSRQSQTGKSHLRTTPAH